MNPSRCRIIAIGKVRKTWVQEGIELYRKRLPGLTIVELRDGNPEKEAELIRQTLGSDEWPVMLMEQGETLTSVSLSERLRSLGSQRLAFVIGGADGLTAELKALAHWKLSLSRVKIPHELARLLLIEQLFRAQAIQGGSPYHRA